MAQEQMSASLALFKAVYGQHKEFVRNTFPAWELISHKKGQTAAFGKWFEYATHVGRPNGGGARPTLGTMPTPSVDPWRSARVMPRFSYQHFIVPDSDLALSETNQQAFISKLKSLQTSHYNAQVEDLVRQFYGDGTGILSEVTGVFGAPVTSVTVQAAGNVVDGAGNPILNGTKYLIEGMDVVFMRVNRTTGALVSEGADGGYVSRGYVGSVTGFSTANIVDAAGAPLAVTLAQADNATNAIVMVRGSATAAGNIAYPFELWGLNAMVSANNPATCGRVSASAAYADVGLETANMYAGINRTTTRAWRAVVSSGPAGAGIPFTLQPGVPEFNALIVKMVERGGGIPTHLLCTGQVEQEYQTAVSSQTQYEPTKFMQGSDKTASVYMYQGQKIPIIVDPQATNNTIFFLNFDELTWLVGKELDWKTVAGQTLWPVENQDASQALLRFYGNIAMCAAQGKILDIACASVQDQ